MQNKSSILAILSIAFPFALMLKWYQQQGNQASSPDTGEKGRTIMERTTKINRTNVNKLLAHMRDIKRRGNYPALMYDCEDKVLFVDEFITVNDYYLDPPYIKCIQRYPTAAASDIMELVEEMQQEYDEEQEVLA